MIGLIEYNILMSGVKCRLSIADEGYTSRGYTPILSRMFLRLEKGMCRARHGPLFRPIKMSMI